MKYTRTVEDFVEDYLAKGYPYYAILSIARASRGGTWRSKVEEILIAKGVIKNREQEIEYNKRVREEYKKHLAEDLIPKHKAHRTK